jgi:hypothetical protein
VPALRSKCGHPLVTTHQTSCFPNVHEHQPTLHIKIERRRLPHPLETNLNHDNYVTQHKGSLSYLYVNRSNTMQYIWYTSARSSAILQHKGSILRSTRATSQSLGKIVADLFDETYKGDKLITKIN